VLEGGGDYADIPLVGVVDGSRVALVGGLSVNEAYHAGVSDLEHEPFLTNLLDSLAGRTGTVLVDGGHRQFNESWALSNEDLVYYQRYLEDQGLSCEQVTPLSRSKPLPRSRHRHHPASGVVHRDRGRHPPGVPRRRRRHPAARQRRRERSDP
jgi:hypothetical protein